MDNVGWLHIGEPLLLNYLEANKDGKITEFMNRKLFRVADTPLSYRQINTLDRDDLLGETKKKKRGWREFSTKEVVYLLIVNDLKQFGFEHKKLSNLWKSFFEEPRKPQKGRKIPDPHINKAVAETAIGCVVGEVEMILVVSKEGDIAFFDPGNYALHDRLLSSLPSAFIHINLNHYINEVLRMKKHKPIPVTWSLSDEYIESTSLGITAKEKKALEIIRNNDYKSVKITKKNGEISVLHAERSNGEVTAKDLLKMLREGSYQDIVITQRDGKVVNMKQEEKFKLKAE